MLPATDDQVVEDSDVQEAQGLLQALSDFAVSFAGLRIPARMVVEEDDGDGVELQGALGDDSAVDFAGVGGAGEEVLGGQDVMLGVEEDDAEDFVRQVSAAGNQIIASLVGAVDAALALKALFQDGRGGEQDALLVHLKLILGLQVLGALHRFLLHQRVMRLVGTDRRSVRPYRTRERAPRKRRTVKGRNKAPASRRRSVLAVGTAKLGFPLRGPALVEIARACPTRPAG